MTGRSNERPLFIEVDACSAVLSPDRKRVWLRIGRPHPDLGFDPDIVLAMDLDPAEAKTIGMMLRQRADEAEDGSSRLN